jgi:hypothetical protein
MAALLLTLAVRAALNGLHSPMCAIDNGAKATCQLLFYVKVA